MEKRRKKGTGTISEYEPGKWLAKVVINGKPFPFYGDTEKGVTKRLDDFLDEMSKGKKTNKKISYSEFLDIWLEMKKEEVKIQTYERIKTDLDCHIKKELGFYNLDRIDDTIIKEFLKKQAKKLSYEGVKRNYDNINASLRYARSLGKIISNPVDLVPKPRSTSAAFLDEQKDEDELQILTDDEIKRFVEACNATSKNGIRIYPNSGIYLFMLNTGLRIGEAAALEWSQYNEKKGTIRIYGTKIRYKDESGKEIIAFQKNVKTVRSARTIKLNKKALEALPIKRDGKYIYGGKGGHLINHSNLYRMFKAICKRAGIEDKSSHCLRDTFASKLFANGVDVKIVSEILGHTKVSTTYDKYITLIQAQKAEVMDSLEVY